MASNDYLKVSRDKQYIQANWEALERDLEIRDLSRFRRRWNLLEHGGRDGLNPGRRHASPGNLSGCARPAGEHRNVGTGKGNRAHGDYPAGGLWASKIGAAVEKEYLLPGGGFYAFSRNANGSVDSSPTVFPVGCLLGWYLQAAACPANVRSLGCAGVFSTDSGARDLSKTVPFFDPISSTKGLYGRSIPFGLRSLNIVTAVVSPAMPT